MKKLYLQKMGMDYTADIEPSMKGSDVGNYRIRGTFHDKDKNIIFIEFSNTYEYDKKFKPISRIKLHITHQFNTSISWDENKSHIQINDLSEYNYTKKDILNYINSNFGTDFTELDLIDTTYTDYDYHTEPGDTYNPDTEIMEQNKKIFDYFYEYERNENGKKYPNFSMYYENHILTVLLHYNCYNDIVKIDNPLKFKFDYKKPIEKIKEAERRYYGTYHN